MVAKHSTGTTHSMAEPTPAKERRWTLSLRAAVTAFVILVIALAWCTWAQTREETPDGKQTIVFWGSNKLGDDVYTLINRFEKSHPQYRVQMGTAAARDLTGDAQRLLTAVAGGVPPDLVFFDRFAVGEWAARGALTDLTPYIQAQDPKDPYKLDLSEYYPWAVAEGSYQIPGATGPAHLYGMPIGADIRALYCQNDRLRQEGMVDAEGKPKPPQTWEELREAAKKLSRFRIAGDPSSGMTRLGFAPQYGNSWLYIYAFQAGGNMLSPDGKTVTMASPPVVRALRFMTDIYDDLGGAAQVNAFQQGFQSGPLDPFLTGTVAMKIDGDWCLEGLAAWRPDLDFSVTPAPMPADELAKGRQPLTWAGGYAYVIPAHAHTAAGAFALIQYLRSWEATSLLEQGNRERQHSQGRMYLPGANANRVQYEKLVTTYIDHNPDIPPCFKAAYATFRQLMLTTRIRPVSAIGQMLWNQQVAATDDANNHTLASAAKAAGKDEIEYCLSTAAAPAQQALDAYLHPPGTATVDWWPSLDAYAVLVVALLGAAIVVGRRDRRRAQEARDGLVFASPWLLGFIVLGGGAIVFSLVMSFTRYDVLTPAHWVGLGNYAQIAHDPTMLQSLGNTMFMLIRVPLCMAVGLGCALALDRGIRGLGLYRTFFYLPTVMPAVASSLLWMWLLNPAEGFINGGLRWGFDSVLGHAVEAVLGFFSGHAVHLDAPNWLGDPAWSKPSLILMNLWSAGGGIIIWLSGLQNIPKHLYEAARIDGAGPWQRFRTITLPLLTPYILFNLIVGIIGTMQIFTEAYIMTAGGPADSTLFYAYYLFKHAFQFMQMGYASALAWILFAIVLALTLLNLWLSKRWVHYDLG